MSLEKSPADPMSSTLNEEARSERRFRLLAESIPQIVWSTRADGYCDYQNRRWHDYTGLSPEESVGTGWMAVVHPDDRDRCNPVWPAKVPPDRQPHEFEYRLRRRDGVYRWFLVRAEPICDDEDQVVRWFGTSTDIDDRKRAEDAKLRETEERLRLAASSARLGYWDWDIVQNRITWSQSLAEISGIAPEAFGDTIEGFSTQVHPDDRDRVQQAVNQAINEGAPYEIEFRFIKPDGSIRWALSQGKVYYDLNGRAVRMAGIDVDITSRKRDQDRIADSDRFERLIAEVSPAVVYMHDVASGANLHIRGLPFRSLGYHIEEIEALGVNFRDQVMHPEDRARFAWHIARLARSPDGAEVPFEYRMRDAQGRYRWFLSRDKVYDRNPDGTVRLIMGAALELTDRIATEDLFRLEGEPADLAIGEVDYLNDTIYLTPEALRMFGLPENEPVVPRSLIHGMFHDDERDEVMARIARSHDPRGDGLFAMEHRIVRPDGTVRWHSARKKVFFDRDAAGRMMAIRSLLAIRDVTEKKLAEDTLSDSVERFREFCQSDIIGIIFGQTDGGVTFANDEFLRIIGYSRDDFKAGRVSWASATPEEWLRIDEAAIANARDSGGAAPPYEKEYIRKDGSRIPVLVGFLLHGSDQNETIAFILDMTERKKAESFLREADRRKDDFLAMLSHELRNPLSAISNTLEILRLPGRTEEDTKWAEDVASRQLKNLVRIIDDLLDVSRIRSGKIQLKQEPLDLSTIVTRAVDSLGPFIESRNQTLEVAIEAEALPIVGDPTRLEQVIGNLLNNAAKYTETGGLIRISARAEGNEAVVRIRDNGMGISQEMLPVIFDLFAQVDATIDRSHGGLGIGLSLVKKLVEMHGGRTSATSPGVGQGSEFTVRLPLAKTVAATTASGNPSPQRAAGTKFRILLVDDNEDSLKGLARLLKREGHQVFEALDGPSALEVARTHRPEIVLLDLGLPGMSGFEVAEALRSEGLDDSTLIALSGYSQTKDRERSRATGFDHHLSKPVDFDALLELINNRNHRP